MDAPEPEVTEFPRAGARARRWQRFECELHAWLASPDGRFAAWQACSERATAWPEGPAPHPDSG